MTWRERLVRFVLWCTGTSAILPGDDIQFSVAMLDIWRDGPYEASLPARVVDIIHSDPDDAKVVCLTNT